MARKKTLNVKIYEIYAKKLREIANIPCNYPLLKHLELLFEKRHTQHADYKR